MRARVVCVCAELSTLWRVRRTIHAMLAERGYLLTQDDMNMTMDDFKATFGDNPPSVDNDIHSRCVALPDAFSPIPHASRSPRRRRVPVGIVRRDCARHI